MLRTTLVTAAILSALIPARSQEQDSPSVPKDIPSDWWSQVSVALDRGEYLLEPEGPDQLGAPNRAQDFRVRLDAGGLTVVPRRTPLLGDDEPWSFELRTARFGRAGDLRPLAPAGVTLAGERAVRALDGLVEWYVNDSRGLEQGWTIPAAPAGDVRAPLRIGLELAGLALRLAPDGSGGLLVDAAGTARLSYDSLVAWDANGRALPVRFTAAADGVGVEVDARDARYPITVDPLVSGPAWTTDGDQIGASLGLTVGTAGDVNGDGYSDVFAAAPLYDDGELDEGRLLVFLGGPGGPGATAAWMVNGDQVSARLGQGAGAAGDVDGDGYDDLLVGAPLFDDDQVDEGRAWLFLGGPSGLAASAVWSVDGDDPGARLGQVVATAGDVNGDGFADIAIGAPLHDAGGLDAGRALVFHGQVGGPGGAAWTLDGVQVGGDLGRSVATAGDVDGDGFGDLLVGQPHYAEGEADEGRALLFFGTGAGLAATAGWTAQSNQVDARLGFSVSTTGDVNGDGYADIVVGVPGWTIGQNDEGRASVWYGSASGPAASADWSMEGNNAGAGAGFSVAPAGDVDGDGYADLAIGLWSYSNGESDEGAVRVYRGSPSGLPAGHHFEVQGQQPLALLGTSVGAAGDVNGDGYGDLLVGVPGYDDDEANEGRVLLFYGSAEGPSIGANWTYMPGQRGALLGLSVSTAGDVNGDGFSDIVVGAPHYDNSFENDGRAYVFLGSETGPSTLPTWIGTSGQAGASFGNSVTAAGDVNGDGFDDVLVGAPGWDGGQVDEGRALLFAGGPLGVSATPVWTAESNQAGARFGFSLACAGDVNGDGLLDVIIGAPLFDMPSPDEGAAFVYLGSTSGLAAAPAWATESDQADARLGLVVRGVGDVDADGFDDVMVSAVLYDDVVLDEGAAYLHLGSPSGPSVDPDWTTFGGVPGAWYGGGLAGAGDVNGDGYGDVVVGAPRLSNGESTEGRAYVYHGSSTGLGVVAAWMVESDQAGAELGASVDGVGDVNADGYADLLIGLPNFDDPQPEEGAAWLYYGSASGLAGTVGWSATGDRAFTAFGRSVAGAGDVNGDGFFDLLIGAPGYDDNVVDQGRSLLYYGSGGSAGPRAAQQRRADDSAAIGLGGISYGHSVRLQAAVAGPAGFATTPAGRVRVWLEWELATLASGAGGLESGPSLDPGAPGSALVLNELSAPRPYEAYTWRARVAAASPFFPHGTWLHQPWNSRGEKKLLLGVPFEDCNDNEVADSDDIAFATSQDCNGNQVPDECDIAGAVSADVNGNGIPDECEPDCNGNQIPDDWDIAQGTSQDCNGNQVPDECDIASAASNDVNSNGIPDECEPDCNRNQIPDDWDIAQGTSTDLNSNGIPDDCELDCNGNQVPDDWDIAQGTSQDCNGNQIPDECDIAAATSTDVNSNGVPDECEPDCNGNQIPDDWDIAQGTSQDCNGNLIPDECDIAAATSTDVNSNGVPDECEPDCNGNQIPDDWDIAQGTSQDCNGNLIPDECDISAATSTDVNSNGIPDECEPDCNGNQIPDDWDIAQGTSQDCNGNLIPDECDIAAATSTDVNSNGVPDECEPDCNGNLIPDDWDIAQGTSQDCNGNLIPDECDIAAATSTDVNSNGVPDECEPDCNGNQIPDDWDIAQGTSQDCNGNLIPDECDIAAATSTDVNSNGIPDECEPDCNGNQIPDDWDIAQGTSQDCNGNLIPDECDIAAATSNDVNSNGIPDECEPDCNGNQIPDDWDIAQGTSQDCNGNLIPDECDIAAATSNDVNSNGIPDECEPDCNGNQIPDDWDIAQGTSQDCNGNLIPDECDISAATSTDVNSNGIPDECEPDCNSNQIPDDWDIAQGTSQDCNGNLIPDECDIAAATSTDVNSNGVPDECEPDCNGNQIPDDWDIAQGTSQDCNGNLIPDECDIAAATSTDVNSNGIPDECEPDCNGNQIPDDWDIAQGTSQDCNGNLIPDECDIAAATSNDVNSNGIPDECEPDCNSNQIPDDWDIAQGTSQDCNGNLIPDECDIAAATSNDGNLNGVPDECESIGVTFCDPAVNNSSGLPGRLLATGSAVALDNDLTLTAWSLPADQFGYFLNSQTQGFSAGPGGSQGNLCVVGQVGRYTSNIFSSGAAGIGELLLDLPNTPVPSGSTAILAGEVWSFQCWYRDTNPTATSNFTEALEVTFL